MADFNPRSAREKESVMRLLNGPKRESRFFQAFSRPTYFLVSREKMSGALEGTKTCLIAALRCSVHVSLLRSRDPKLIIMLFLRGDGAKFCITFSSPACSDLGKPLLLLSLSSKSD